MRGCVPDGLCCHSFVLLGGIQGGSLGRTASAGLRFQPSAIHPSTMLLSMTSCTRKRSRMPSQYYPLSSLRWRLFVDGGSGRGPGVTRRLPHPGAALSHTECPPIDDTGCTDQAVSVARDPAFCTVVHFTSESSFPPLQGPWCCLRAAICHFLFSRAKPRMTLCSGPLATSCSAFTSCALVVTS